MFELDPVEVVANAAGALMVFLVSTALCLRWRKRTRDDDVIFSERHGFDPPPLDDDEAEPSADVEPLKLNKKDKTHA